MLWKILMSLHISISSVDQHRRVPIHQLCSLVSMGTTDPYLCWGLKQNGSYFHTSTTVLHKMWEEMQSRRTGRAEFYGWEEKKKKWYTCFFSSFFIQIWDREKEKGKTEWMCVCECERQRHCIWRIKRRKSPNFFFSDDFFEHGPYCSGPMGADWSKKEIVIMIKIESLKFYYSYKYNLPLFKNRFCHLFIKPASFQVFKVLSVPFINRGIYF